MRTLPLTLVACALAASAALAQRIPDSSLRGPQSTLVIHNLKICADGSRVYVAWTDGHNSEIYLNRSLDSGATWLPAERRVDHGPASALSASICCEGDDVRVAWEDNRFDFSPLIVLHDVMFNRSTDGGLTWLPADLRVSTGPGSSQRIYSPPQVGCHGGNVYVTWSGGNNVYFNGSTDDGTTWPLATVLATSHQDMHPHMAWSGLDVDVAFEMGAFPNFDIYAQHSSDGGATWLAVPNRVNTDPPLTALSSRPRLCRAANRVFAVWADQRNGAGSAVYFNRSLDGGLTWQSLDVRLDTAGVAGPPDIAAAGNHVYVVWPDLRNGANQLYFNASSDGGATWFPSDVLIHTHPATQVYSVRRDWSLAASEAGVFVVWIDDQRNNATSADIYCNRSTDGGVTWLPTDVRLTTAPPSGTHSYDPVVTASGDAVYAAWLDSPYLLSAPGRSGLFFNIPFGFQPYGTGLAGSGNITPTLVASGPATIGGAFDLDLDHCLGGAVAYWLAGTRASSPLFGGTILVAPGIVAPVPLGGPVGVPGAAGTSLHLLVPNDVTVVGLPIAFQAGVLDGGAIQGVALTAGVEMWIG